MQPYGDGRHHAVRTNRLAGAEEKMGAPHQPGSIPFAAMTLFAASEVKKLTKSRANTGFCADDATATANEVVC
jgi:hypothetical protein